MIIKPNTNPNKKSFVTNLQIQDEEGKKMNVLINPYKEAILINTETINNVFTVTLIN